MKDFKGYLPSNAFLKKAGIISVIALLIIIAVIIIKKRKAAYDANHITIGELAEQDANNDGVPDWQDRLNALRQERLENPDFITPQQEGLSAPGTQTDQLARDLFVAFNAISAGGELDLETKEMLAEKLTGYVSTVNETKTWTRTDLQIMGNDISAISQYVGEYAIFTNLYKPLTSPIDVLEQAIHFNDPTKLEPLVELQQHHQDALEGLSQMHVPQQAAVYHLAIMNSIQRILDDVIAIQQYFNDPLLTFSAITGYNNHIQNYTDSINSMNEKYLLPLYNSMAKN